MACVYRASAHIDSVSEDFKPELACLRRYPALSELLRGPVDDWALPMLEDGRVPPNVDFFWGECPC
jgi:hypothetical protein